MNDFQKVLIIEDEPIVLQSLSTFLVQQYDVLTATDGKVGLDMIRKYKPDIVLLDLIIPGLHGLEVLKKVKDDENISNIPIIILSNVSSTEEINKSHELGAADYLIKETVNFEIIRYKIELALQSNRGFSE